jgi:hypothetical protein
MGVEPGTIAAARVGWLSEVPTSGQLPVRTVIVPSEAVAHAWRRDVVVLDPSLLVGTQFITPLGAALSLLAADTSVVFSAGEEAVRAARVAAVLREDIAFEHFDQAVFAKDKP